MLRLRKKIPIRTCTKQYKQYRYYKPYLQDDFNSRCGYCDVVDIRYGGVRNFHIDHFRPKNPFPHLENDYSNLVYACSYCNGGKSNDWPSGVETHSVLNGMGYIDPCDDDYDNHLQRYEDGRIRPLTDVGNYMFKKLNFGLRRHQLAWKYEQLEVALDSLRDEIRNFSGEDTIKSQLHEFESRLIDKFFENKYAFEETL